MNIKYLKHYLNKCKEKGEHASFEGLKNWHKKYFEREGKHMKKMGSN